MAYFIEALNKQLTENLFKVQDMQELNDPGKVSLTWLKHLYGLIDKRNDTKTQMIVMSPKDAIELKEDPLVSNRVMYYLADGLEIALMKKELMLISDISSFSPIF